MIAALGTHHIGVRHPFHFLLRRSSDCHLTCITLGFLGRKSNFDCEQSATIFDGCSDPILFYILYPCHGAVGSDIFTISVSRNLLDTHLTFGKRSAAPRSCSASFLISFVLSSSPGSCYGLAELKHCSHGFHKHHKNHESKYNKGQRTFSTTTINTTPFPTDTTLPSYGILPHKQIDLFFHGIFESTVGHGFSPRQQTGL